jgi:hypothetical protein
MDEDFPYPLVDDALASGAECEACGVTLTAETIFIAEEE